MHLVTLRPTMRPANLERDGARMIAYARDLFAISFGGTRFADQFGEDGAAYIPWVAQKQALARENAGIFLLEGEPAGMVLVVESFMAFASDEAYLAGLGHRTAAVEDSRLLPLVETL